MNARIIIRPAVRDDLEAISRLRTESILEAVRYTLSNRQAQSRAAAFSNDRTLNRIRDECVLVGVSGRSIVATNSLDLEEGEMRGLVVKPGFRRQGLGRRMVVEIERLAIQFGMEDLRVDASLASREFFRDCRYHAREDSAFSTDLLTGLDCRSMVRVFPKRQTRYGRRIRRLLEQIGIPQGYGRSRALRLQPESRELATIGLDGQGREQMLHPDAARAWYRLRNAALGDGIRLSVVSGYRSVGYQVSIVERKRQAGQTIGEILEVSAAPGFSEHHSGFAIDLACPGSDPLEECFENTSAFEWLSESADRYGFSMTYPRNNHHGIAYEPWHWCFHPSRPVT